MREAGLHAVHTGLHGNLSLRFVLPALLVTQQEETTQLLAPRRQQGCNGNTRTHAHTYAQDALVSAQHGSAHVYPRGVFKGLCVSDQQEKTTGFVPF